MPYKRYARLLGALLLILLAIAFAGTLAFMSGRFDHYPWTTF